MKLDLQVWEDKSLAEWDPSDYRIFCGDLGNEVWKIRVRKAIYRSISMWAAKKRKSLEENNFYS